MVKDGFMAVQGHGSILSHCVCYKLNDNGQSRQIFCTNGVGENGTLTDLIVTKDESGASKAFMVVKHYSKGYTIVFFKENTVVKWTKIINMLKFAIKYWFNIC